jgi:hypothetical protein
MHTKFHKDWFRHSKADGRIHRQHDDPISLLQNKESRLKIEFTVDKISKYKINRILSELLKIANNM